MLHIAIVDDDADSIRLIHRYLDRCCRARGLETEITAFRDAKDLMKRYEKTYDLIFLDIDMPGMNGLDAASAIRKTDLDTALIFVTQMAQYAINGYKVDALDFLVKPVEYFSFEMAFRKFLRLYHKQESQNITLMIKGKLTILSFPEIRYIEVMDHYLTYHTLRGDFTIKGKLADVETSLKNGPFFKCNRCYLVNVRAITAVEKDCVLIGDVRIEVSRSKRREMMQAVVSSMGGDI